MNLLRRLPLPGLLLLCALSVRAETYTATDVPRPIPDGPAGIAESHIVVPVNRVIEDVNVTLTITHPFDGDLGIYLVPPQGDLVRLAFRCGHAGDNYVGTVFDDEATASVVNGTAPFSGSYTPDSPLQVLDGLGAGGNWMLRVTDFARNDSGTLQAWQLNLTLGDTLASPEPHPGLPTTLALAAWPNPFNAATRLTFSLARPSPVTLTVYNLAGQPVARLAQSVYPAGTYSRTFDAAALATGVYLARLEAAHSATTTRLLLIK
jgi:subtilisin-like proprotein convertase family protein